MRIFILLLFLVSLASCTRYIYVVRHAEKETAGNNNSMMSNDPPLSEKGKQRAEALKEVLAGKKIGYIFCTNTVRTKSTAEPTRSLFNVTIENYRASPDSAFIARIHLLTKNILIVGHSNTVDDIVNKLCGSVKIPGDLADHEYDNLYILRKKGKNTYFEQKKYGMPASQP